MAMTVDEFKEKMQNAFNNHDVNKNGVLEKSEAMALSKKIHEGQGMDFDEAKFEENFNATATDGKLSFDAMFAKILPVAQAKGVVA